MKKKRDYTTNPELNSDPSWRSIVQNSSWYGRFDNDKKRNSVKLFWNVEIPSKTLAQVRKLQNALTEMDQVLYAPPPFSPSISSFSGKINNTLEN